MTKIDKDYFPKDAYLILYGNIVPVKGYRRSTLCDGHREEFYLIPNALYELIVQGRDMTIGGLLEWAGPENEETVYEYFHYLMENELAMVTPEPELFPVITTEYRSPHPITNALLDLNEDSEYDFLSVAKQLSDLGCLTVEVRCFFPATKEKLLEIGAAFDESRLKSIEIVTGWNPDISNEEYSGLLMDCGRLISVVISGAPKNEEIKGVIGQGDIRYVTQVIDSADCCGFISKKTLCTNITIITEAMNYNSCLNRKVGIDVEGNIKNCPSSSQTYGSVIDTQLQDVVRSEEFTAKWMITKDQIEICKDCEFRYLCTDCRVFTEDAQNPYSKPARCNYDPYQAKWAVEKQEVLNNA
ncbi:MAG: grasp-with-spasm system SPASM domain peptide maturase [Bacteroidota bacterium]